jgi:hypothetical protein
MPGEAVGSAQRSEYRVRDILTMNRPNIVIPILWSLNAAVWALATVYRTTAIPGVAAVAATAVAAVWWHRYATSRH